MTNVPSDFYRIDDLLTNEERALRYRVRRFVQTEVEPIINDYWERAEFPTQIIPKLADLGIAGGVLQGYGCPGISNVGMGMVALELARGDASISTFLGMHSTMAMGAIGLLGSDDQKKAWLPAMARMETIGCFALTEPQSASQAFMPTTTAHRDGSHWVINGMKRWIGNANMADLAIIWAINNETRRVNGFVVRTNTPGYAAAPIRGKIAARALINCDVSLDNVTVPLDAKLDRANSFADAVTVLQAARVGAAWQAVGHAMAAYEYALAYAKERQAFGKPIARFQMIQDKLVRMLGGLTSIQLLALRLSQLADAGITSDEQASLAKVQCCATARQVVALGREILGGNGILLDHHVARHFVDVEVAYTGEGTNEINTLVVGRAITGSSALL